MAAPTGFVWDESKIAAAVMAVAGSLKNLELELELELSLVPEQKASKKLALTLQFGQEEAKKETVVVKKQEQTQVLEETVVNVVSFALHVAGYAQFASLAALWM